MARQTRRGSGAITKPNDPKPKPKPPPTPKPPPRPDPKFPGAPVGGRSRRSRRTRRSR